MKTRGFSLLEVIIALSLLGVVAALALLVSRSALDASVRQAEALETQQTAEAIFEILERDLESALFLHPGWLQAEVSAESPAEAGGFLAFITVNTQGLPTAVAYELRFENPRQPDKPDDQEWGLFRSQIDPTTTLHTYTLNAGATPAWSSADFWPQETADSFAGKSLLAEGVAGFELYLEKRNSHGIVETVALPFASSSERLHRVRISLRLLSNRGQNLLQTGVMETADIVAQHGFQYVRWVDFWVEGP